MRVRCAEPGAVIGVGDLRSGQCLQTRRRGGFRAEILALPRPGHRGLRRRVDGDGELDVAAELRDSAWVTSARSRVSSCSLTNSFGVAISAVFSTRPSGLVSFSQAR